MKRRTWQLRVKLQEPQSRSTRWRKGLQAKNPEKYERLKKLDRERKREARRKLKNDTSREARMKRKRENENSVERVRRMRQQRKEKIAAQQLLTQSNISSKNSDGQTTQKGISRREYHRLYKQRQRATLSRQKRYAVKLKDKYRKSSQPQVCENNNTSTLMTNNILPNSPTKFASAVENILQTATPPKKKELNKLALSCDRKDRQLQAAITEGMKETFKELGKKQRKGARVTRNALHEIHLSILKKYRLKSFAYKRIGINCKGKPGGKMFSIPGKSPSRTIGDKQKTDVEGMYEAFSSERPEKKFKGKRLMNFSLRSAYRKYAKISKSKPVAWTTFRRMKPSTVKKLTKSHLFMCQCVYCVNLQFKLNSLRHVIISSKNDTTDPVKSSVTDLSAFIDTLMCPKSNASRYHDAKCINDQCGKCSDKPQRIEENFSSLNKARRASWRRWERREVTFCSRDKKSVQKVRRMLVTKSGSLDDMIKELIEDSISPTAGVSIAQHIFNAQWQNEQCRALKKNLGQHTVMMILDFGENITVKYQDEIKSAHYAKNQITVHPVVAYYKEGTELVREAMIVLSDHLQHDHDAVNKFVSDINKYLTEVRGLQIEMEVQFSDGATMQYKCASAFADLSFAEKDFSFPIIRCFYGSEHGKGESDGETGILKTKLDEAIVGQGVVVNTAEDLFRWCTSSLTEVTQPKPGSLHQVSRRSFFLIQDIPSARERTSNMKTMAGTRKVHSVMSTGKPYQVKTRNLSCFCKECCQGNFQKCENHEYVGPWKVQKLKQKVTNHPNPHLANTDTQKSPAEEKQQVVSDAEVTVTDQGESASGVTMMKLKATSPEQNDPRRHFLSLDVDHWVAVIYDDQWWPGIIIRKSSPSDYVINFMKPVGYKSLIMHRFQGVKF